jgi:tetratricopeptide (TPR) repeat protein
MGKSISRIAAASLIALLGLAAFAQAQGRDLEKEKAIWQELEAMAPATVTTFRAATGALDKGEFQEAARLYEEVLKKAPESDFVYRRLGTSLALAGRVEEGLAWLETAVEKKASPENLYSFAQFLAYPGGDKESTKANKSRALALARQAHQSDRGSDPYYAVLHAALALDLHEERDFREATKELVQKHPQLMQTHYFNAIRSALDEEWITAEREIKAAQSMGLPPEPVKSFLDSGVRTRARVWRCMHYVVYLVAAWAGGLVLLYFLGKLLSNLTLCSIERSDPNAGISLKEASLRRSYRRLINFSGIYYYISLPVVIFLVAAVAGSIIYGFLLLGRVPVKLTVIVVGGAAVTIYQAIHSLFIRCQAEDPGRSLRHEEAPGLWELAREVARTVGTRLIDDIRVTAGTDLAVYEKGSVRERMQDRARRILVLGVGVLNGLNQNAFRALLAHEYSHFSHRDTAGGDVALRVSEDMLKFAYAMARSGLAVSWNVAFQFLRLYNFIFRRISHGATRLQEVLADRIAVLNYGAAVFEEGLRHVIRRSVEFGFLASKEIQEAAAVRRELADLYQLPEVTGTDAETLIEEKIHRLIDRPTSEDDTHPSPAERFRLAGRIAAKAELTPAGLVWELFTNRESLTAEMSSLINKQVKAGAA